MHITLPLASVLLFLVSLMFLVGLLVPPGDVLATLKNPSLIVRALVANVVLMPLLAILITDAVRLPEDIAIGVLLMSAAPGVPFLPRMVGSAKGNLPFAVGLMFVLQVASVVTTPVTLNLILPVDAAVRVPVLRVVVTLVLFQLVPLVLGTYVRHRSATVAGALARPIRLLSLLGLVGTIVFLIVPHLDVLGKVFGGGALLIMLGLVVVAWPIGWALGGPEVGTRKTLALGTSMRNVGLCLLVASRNFPETGVAAAVGSYLVIQAVANLIFSKYLGRAPETTATAARHI
jgi:BASS family bile acid:Na+ symporter